MNILSRKWCKCVVSFLQFGHQKLRFKIILLSKLDNIAKGKITGLSLPVELKFRVPFYRLVSPVLSVP